MSYGLKFCRRTNKRGCYNIAAYHDPRSLTWSWVLSASFDSWSRRSSLGWLVGKIGKQMWFRIPFVGELRFQWQSKMFKRGEVS